MTKLTHNQFVSCDNSLTIKQDVCEDGYCQIRRILIKIPSTHVCRRFVFKELDSRINTRGSKCAGLRRYQLLH
jgi:hypothetical protein